MISFGQKIKKLRSEMGYSQAYLAELVGVSTQSVSNWECDNSMPDISQIVPLAGSLLVSTDFLLGVGMDEAGDKDKLEKSIKEIWTHYSVNTKDNNADMMVCELYFDYLRKYPMDYPVKYNCAFALHDYLKVATMRKKFETSEKEIGIVYSKCDKLLNSIICNSVDIELQINACKLMVEHLLMGNKHEEAKLVAKKLPINAGMKDEALSRIMLAEGRADEYDKKALEASKKKCLDYLMSLCEYAANKDYDLATLKAAEMIAEYSVKMYMPVTEPKVNSYMEMPYCYWIISITMQSNKYIQMGDFSSAYQCLNKATQIAGDMYTWVRDNTTDKLVIEDYEFFAKKTPHWSYSFCGMFNEEDNEFTKSKEYKECVSAIKEKIGVYSIKKDRL